MIPKEGIPKLCDVVASRDCDGVEGRNGQTVHEL